MKGENKPFYILIGSPFFNIGNVISANGKPLLVMAYYKKTWWRKLFEKIGFNMHIGCVKVIDE